MQKEIEPIRRLESRHSNLLSILEEGRAVVGRREANSAVKKEQVGTTFEATREYGRYNNRTGIVRRTVDGLQGRLKQLDQDTEEIISQYAAAYLSDLGLKRDQLAEMSDLVAEGNLPEDILRKHHDEYEDLVRLPDNNPLFRKAVEKIREERRGSQEPEHKTQSFPPPFDAIFKKMREDPVEIELPNGRVIKGNEAKFLELLARESSADNPISIQDIGKRIFQDKPQERAAPSVYDLAFKTRRNLFGTRVGLINKLSPQERFKGGKSAYYLKISEQKTAVECKEESFKFEDGEVVTGEVGRLLTKLYPFNSGHIVEKSELSEEGIFDEHLQVAKGMLMGHGLRLAEIPNLKDPDNIGCFYVETYRPPVRVNVLGDTIKYRNEQDQEKQIRLTEEQSNLLRVLSSGEHRTAKELSGQTTPGVNLMNAVSGLNTVLAEVTGIEEVIVSVGNENFGYWFRIKDASVTCRVKYLPLHPTRMEALKLIFEDDNVSKEQIINTLGQTRGVRRPARLLTEKQASVVFRRSLSRLRNRVSENILTEEEADIVYDKMQEFTTRHGFQDRKDVMGYIEKKLGLVPADSMVSGDDDLFYEVIDDFDVDNTHEDGDFGEAGGETAIETSGFGSLSREEVALVAVILQRRKEQIAPFLQQRGIEFMNDGILRELINLVDGFRPQGLSEMTSAQIIQAMIDYERQTLGKVKEMIIDSQFDSILDEIYQKNPAVWEMLINVSDITSF